MKGSMRENGFRALGGLAQRLTSGLADKRSKGRGASIARLKAEWSAHRRRRTSRASRSPTALLAGRGGQGGQGLAAEASRARPRSRVQHRAAQIVERVNAYFGHGFIDEIRLVQGAIARRRRAAAVAGARSAGRCSASPARSPT